MNTSELATNESKYQAGQVWNYKTRPHEHASAFSIVVSKAVEVMEQAFK